MWIERKRFEKSNTLSIKNHLYFVIINMSELLIYIGFN